MEWIFEPGHSGAQFRVKHMMVSWVRGQFKNINGILNFDPKEKKELSFVMQIDANGIDTGLEARDNHLRSVDFLDVENHPKISFKTTASEKIKKDDFLITGDLVIRGIVKPIQLTMEYLGQQTTPFWTDKGHQGSVQRVGFSGKTIIDRHDFAVDWNDDMEGLGLVVGADVHIAIDIEAILKSELEKLMS